MIIEFIGAPGAGKTTLLPAVAHFFETEAYRTYTVVQAARPFVRRTRSGKVVQRLTPAAWQRPLLWRLFYLQSVAARLRFMALHPQLIAQVMGSQRGRPARANVRQRAVLPWLFRHMGYYEFLRRHAQPDEVLLFDEGFVHRVVQLFTSSVEKPAPAAIAAYIALLPQPDLVIYVRAATAVCEQRIYERGLWPHAQQQTPVEISQFVQHAHEAAALAVAQAHRRKWQVLAVANDGVDLTAVQADLWQQLHHIQLNSQPNWEVQTAS